MERLARFHRRSKKDSTAPTAAPTPAPAPAPAPTPAQVPVPAAEEDKTPGTRTPSPASNGLAPPPARPREKQSKSPFRGFHLRPSAKRSRESPPASLPQSPTAAPHAQPNAVAPLSAKPSPAVQDVEPAKPAPKPKIPSFLTLSAQEIEQKFHELVWLERSRLMQSITNPSPDFRFARVSGPHLRHLDRYMNVQPWDNNRIRLQVPPGHVDYINASPITLTTCAPSDKAPPPDRYIAMQGPKQSSLDHVWRMVVEQLRSPGVIVMLTETHEANIEKCYPYFPRVIGDEIQINERDEFGDGFRASVRCEAMEGTPAGDAIELRKLVVRVHRRRPLSSQSDGASTCNGAEGLAAENIEDVDMKSPVAKEQPDADVIMKSPVGDGGAGAPVDGNPRENGDMVDGEGAKEDDGSEEVDEERIVYHFLFKKWPDFGVPALADLDSFFTLMRLSRQKNADPDNPRIVHCSAGVGRSGTFIALEHLMRELDAGVLENYDARSLELQQQELQGLPQGGEDGGAEAEQQDKRPDTTETEGEDLIFSTVNQLREQRRTMVQSEAQYLFIYQVMRKLWQDKYGMVEEAEPAAKRLEVDPFVEG